MTPATHSTLGPSGAERWIACPGSIALCERAGKSVTGFAAAEGTVAHALAEPYASGKIEYELLCSKVGQTVRQDGHDIPIIDEMVDGAAEYLDAIQEARKFFADNSRPMGTVEAFERRVKATSIAEQCWGTADHFLYRKGHVLYVDDYKFGKGKVVEVKNNPQASIYAIAIMDEVGDAFDGVRVRIIQPRGNHSDGPVREWRTTPAELRKWAAEVARPAALETRKEGARLCAGDWCRWCDGMALCPLIAKKAQDAAQADFSVVATSPQAKKLPDPLLLTTEQLAKVLSWQDVVESYFVAVKALATQKLEQGESVPGFKLVMGRSNREWRDEKEVVAAYGDVLGEALWEKKILSPAKLEKAVRAKRGSIDHLTIKPEGKRSIAPESDPRPAVAASAKTDFQVVGGKALEVEVVCPQCEIMGACPRCESKKQKRGPVWPV